MKKRRPGRRGSRNRRMAELPIKTGSNLIYEVLSVNY